MYFSRTPNVIALEDIKSVGINPNAKITKGNLFYIDIKEGGGNKIPIMGSELIVLGQNARLLTNEEVDTLKAKGLLKVGINVAQELGDKALNEEGLVRKSNVAWWLLGGVVVYLVFFKK
jgi:hypothetical protein